MPIVQSNFNNAFPIALPGMVANGELSNRITRTCEDAAGVGFGRAVFRGANDMGATKTVAATDLLGITMSDRGLPTLPGATVDTFPQYYNLPIMERGAIWVTAGAAFPAAGVGVSVLTATGEFVPAGTASSTPLPNWVADTVTANGGMVRISNNRQP